MRTVTNYTTPGNLGVAVDDTVRLYLDTVVHPGLPEFIAATVKYPIVPVNCGAETSYSFEYDETDLLGVVALLVPADIVDVVTVSENPEVVITQNLIEGAIVNTSGFLTTIGENLINQMIADADANAGISPTGYTISLANEIPDLLPS